MQDISTKQHVVFDVIYFKNVKQWLMRVCCIKECKNKAIVKRDKLTNCDEEEKEKITFHEWVYNNFYSIKILKYQYYERLTRLANI